MLLQSYKSGVIEVGCDEAGRGPLAGPVFAAAVILPPNYQNEVLDDSKKLNEKTRTALREQIENDAIAYHVAFCSNEEIDKYNILNASILAMHRALDGLCECAKTRPAEIIKPEFIIVDGNKFKNYPCSDINIFLKSKFRKSNELAEDSLFVGGQIPYTTIVKGDSKYLSIAAASILAKTYRDAYMDLLHRAYPQYAWDRNRAYPTVAHYKAIAEYGITPFHRKSFRLI